MPTLNEVQCFASIDSASSVSGMTAMKINGIPTNTASLIAGSVVQIEYDYLWSYLGFCPDCYVQIYAGVVGNAGTCPDSFNNQNGPSPNPYPIIFTAQ